MMQVNVFGSGQTQTPSPVSEQSSSSESSDYFEPSPVASPAHPSRPISNTWSIQVGGRTPERSRLEVFPRGRAQEIEEARRRIARLRPTFEDREEVAWEQTKAANRDPEASLALYRRQLSVEERGRVQRPFGRQTSTPNSTSSIPLPAQRPKSTLQIGIGAGRFVSDGFTLEREKPLSQSPRRYGANERRSRSHSSKGRGLGTTPPPSGLLPPGRNLEGMGGSKDTDGTIPPDSMEEEWDEGENPRRSLHVADDAPRPNYRAYDNRFLAPRPAPAPRRVRRREAAPKVVEKRDKKTGDLPALKWVLQGIFGGALAGVRGPKKPLSNWPAEVGSFSKPPDEEELAEVWKDLDEGVSQRSVVHPVVRARANAKVTKLAAAAAAVTGEKTYPKLTPGVLEEHDKVMHSMTTSPTVNTAKVQVVPMPKNMEEVLAQDIEQGMGEKGGSVHSFDHSLTLPYIAVRNIMVGYMLVALCASHLIYNLLLTLNIVDDLPLWGLCLIPGVVGMLVHLNGLVCRMGLGGRVQQGTNDNLIAPEASEDQRPHLCAIPIHIMFLLSIVASMMMHLSALVYCKAGRELLLPPSYSKPVCDKHGSNALLLPIAFEVILFFFAAINIAALARSLTTAK
ncbi:unnamed protein product [Discosporangium mesarthrocarpum]